MTHYLATFANGDTKEIKASLREYAVAWKFTATNEHMGDTAGGVTITQAGFARNAELAAKAIATESRHWVKGNPRPRWNGDRVIPAGKLVHSEIVHTVIVGA